MYAKPISAKFQPNVKFMVPINYPASYLAGYLLANVTYVRRMRNCKKKTLADSDWIAWLREHKNPEKVKKNVKNKD